MFYIYYQYHGFQRMFIACPCNFHKYTGKYISDITILFIQIFSPDHFVDFNLLLIDIHSDVSKLYIDLRSKRTKVQRMKKSKKKI